MSFVSIVSTLSQINDSREPVTHFAIRGDCEFRQRRVHDEPETVAEDERHDEMTVDRVAQTVKVPATRIGR